MCGHDTQSLVRPHAGGPTIRPQPCRSGLSQGARNAPPPPPHSSPPSHLFHHYQKCPCQPHPMHWSGAASAPQPCRTCTPTMGQALYVAQPSGRANGRGGGVERWCRGVGRGVGMARCSSTYECAWWLESGEPPVSICDPMACGRRFSPRRPSVEPHSERDGKEYPPSAVDIQGPTTGALPTIGHLAFPGRDPLRWAMAVRDDLHGQHSLGAKLEAP